MFLYFTLSLNINCLRKQQKLEIKRGLHSLRLDRNLVWDHIKNIVCAISDLTTFKDCLSYGAHPGYPPPGSHHYSSQSLVPSTGKSVDNKINESFDFDNLRLPSSYGVFGKSHPILRSLLSSNPK